MRKKIIFIFIFLGFFYSAGVYASQWEDWELGGELGLGVGAGNRSGRILSPSLMVTGTRVSDDFMIELGLGYLFGSREEENYRLSGEYEKDYEPEIWDQQENDVRVRMSVVPMTINFHYVFYENFYVGAGVGLYHLFYSKEPLGHYRAEPDSEPGETVTKPASTALGFQQMVGMEIFPVSPNWNWFVGMKSFVTTPAGPAGTLFGATIGGKVRYTW